MTKRFTAPSEKPDAKLEGIRVVQGRWTAHDLRWGIVVSRFNDELTNALLHHAVDTLLEHGAERSKITVVRVPGAYEIPFMIKQLAAKKEVAALLALGVIIQGETPHAERIHDTSINRLLDIACTYDIPVIDGIVMAQTLALAEARCTHPTLSRGRYTALAAMEMAGMEEMKNEK